MFATIFLVRAGWLYAIEIPGPVRFGDTVIAKVNESVRAVLSTDESVSYLTLGAVIKLHHITAISG